MSLLVNYFIPFSAKVSDIHFLLGIKHFCANMCAGAFLISLFVNSARDISHAQRKQVGIISRRQNSAEKVCVGAMERMVEHGSLTEYYSILDM